MATFMVVPSWQGSGSSRAMRLIDGADAIRGDLPSTATVRVEVPVEAGESLDTGVHRLSSLLAVREHQLAALREATSPVITIGGGCAVALGSVEYAAADGDVCVLWIDAHTDLNDAVSSPSGSFDGMVLRSLLGEGIPELASTAPLDPSQVVILGARSMDDAEQAVIEERSIRMLSVDDWTPESVIEAVSASGASKVFIHIDLDVLDPADIAGTSWAEPFGLPAAHLVDLIGAVRGSFELAGATICGFAPSSPERAVDDLPTILRIIGALAR
ncbi:arginase family protein [Mycetocola zhujimingii]|uniref:arginase family protein n=1 Tax=Mycetocola zhujimingii TaxID=2079792 RepID=UPI000D367423|nr:arginase family protein [Mycetocola zhujimingii]AWB85871.1 arginase [Mycetocola zhujimingii]